jgi:hypothetical protein
MIGMLTILAGNRRPPYDWCIASDGLASPHLGMIAARAGRMVVYRFVDSNDD